MKTLPLPFVTLFFLASLEFSYSAPPFDPYTPRKPYDLTIKEHKITIEAVRVITYSDTGTRALEIQYRPSSTSTNMWTHIVEMYDVAQHFVPLAQDEKAPKVAVTPLIYSGNSDKQNTTYTYTIKDYIATPDWHVEFQPWFRDKKEDA